MNIRQGKATKGNEADKFLAQNAPRKEMDEQKDNVITEIFNL